MRQAFRRPRLRNVQVSYAGEVSQSSPCLETTLVAGLIVGSKGKDLVIAAPLGSKTWLLLRED